MMIKGGNSSSPNSNPHTFRWLASVRRYVLPPKNEKIIPPEEKIVKVKWGNLLISVKSFGNPNETLVPHKLYDQRTPCDTSFIEHNNCSRVKPFLHSLVKFCGKIWCQDSYTLGGGGGGIQHTLSIAHLYTVDDDLEDDDDFETMTMMIMTSMLVMARCQWQRWCCQWQQQRWHRRWWWCFRRRTTSSCRRQRALPLLSTNSSSHISNKVIRMMIIIMIMLTITIHRNGRMMMIKWRSTLLTNSNDDDDQRCTFLLKSPTTLSLFHLLSSINWKPQHAWNMTSCNWHVLHVLNVLLLHLSFFYNITRTNIELLW